MRLLWLADVLRGVGLTVHEYGGWRTRGSADWGPIQGITCHHTAGSRTSTDAGELSVLVNGSSSAPPPIAQLYLSRSGQWWAVASGKCFHNKVGWGGPNEGYGNTELIGIEAQHSGGDEPWTSTQYQSYARGVAALCDHLNIPVSRVAGHKEHQPGSKFDPTFNMDNFRTLVTQILNGDADMPLTESDANVVWAAKASEYVDEHGDGARDLRTVKDVLFATHAVAVGLARDSAEREAADAAQTALIQQVLAVAGNPMTEAQFQQALDLMRQAATEAGAAATQRVEDKLDAQAARLAQAARAEADVLGN
jgi:hypothetical protein